MNEPDGMTITREDFADIKTSEQAVNFVEHKIQCWSDWTLRRPPPPTDVINAKESITWLNRLNIAYGEIVGGLQALYAVGLISDRQFSALKLKIISATIRKSGAVQMGVDP